MSKSPGESGLEGWGFYPTGTALPSGVTQHWFGIQCDANGVLQVSDPPPGKEGQWKAPDSGHSIQLEHFSPAE